MTAWLRTAFYVTLMTVTIAPWSVVVVASRLTPQTFRDQLAQLWTGWAIWGARTILGIRWKVQGWHHLPSGPAIVLAKHQSAWETLWLATYMPQRLSFVYKRELHYLPFFGWGMAVLGMINIDRSRGQDAFEQVVKQGEEHLRDGWWIGIFPEGTRTVPGSTKRYKTGGARLAVRTGTVVIPVAHNSGECWPRDRFVKTPGEITISIGPPIDPRGKSSDQVAAAVEGWIETEMRRLAPHRFSGPYEPLRRVET
ncbi:MAG: lysophospholipid acyltransferase family protein [Betaproteobacteria bacterium]